MKKVKTISLSPPTDEKELLGRVPMPKTISPDRTQKSPSKRVRPLSNQRDERRSISGKRNSSPMKVYKKEKMVSPDPDQRRFVRQKDSTSRNRNQRTSTEDRRI